jgi:hypothetical protein
MMAVPYTTIFSLLKFPERAASPSVKVSKAQPAKSGKKINGPKLGLNGGCFAIFSYIQNQLDETHRLETLGQLWKNHPNIAKLG